MFARRARHAAGGQTLKHRESISVPLAWAETQAARCIQRVSKRWLARQATASKVARSVKGKIGAVVTTHGEFGVFARSAVHSLIEYLPEPFHIILIVNKSSDPVTGRLTEELKRGKNTQVKVLTDDRGGLTRTWNMGIRLCRRAGCTSVILMNHDVVVDQSIRHLVSECHKAPKGDLRYYGPLMNRPGPEAHNQSQQGGGSIDKPPFPLVDRARSGQSAPLNGAIMAFPIDTLENNKYDSVCYFDPSYPYGGNEVEWFRRAQVKGGQGYIVPRCWVHHYKFASWRENSEVELASHCLYTIVSPGARVPSLPLEHGKWDTYLFSRDPLVLASAEAKGWTPMAICAGLGRAHHKIVWNPCGYLPNWVCTSLYCGAAYIDKLEPVGYIQARFDKRGAPLVVWEKNGLVEGMLRQHDADRTGALEACMASETGEADTYLERVQAASRAAGVRCHVRKLEGLGGIVSPTRS